MTKANQPIRLVVGSYCEWDEPGIHLLEIDADSGHLISHKAFEGGKNPSYISMNADKTNLFVVNECDDYHGNNGAVAVFAFDGSNELTLMQRRASGGKLPAHCTYLDKLQTVAVSNYESGTFAFFRTEANKLLSPSIVQSLGVEQNSYANAHAHQIVSSIDKKWLYGVDLGLDRIHVFDIDSSIQNISSHRTAPVTHSGWGPRHLLFHPNGKYAYLVYELEAKLSVLEYNPDNGSLHELQTASLIPSEYSGENKAAAIKLSPDGRYVYISNRGHNSIAIFAINAATGRVSFVAHADANGHWPRDFTINHKGNLCIVANQKSDHLSVFYRENASGLITFSGITYTVPQPAFVCEL